jgi:hypothetical protein
MFLRLPLYPRISSVVPNLRSKYLFTDVLACVCVCVCVCCPSPNIIIQQEQPQYPVVERRDICMQEATYTALRPKQNNSTTAIHDTTKFIYRIHRTCSITCTRVITHIIYVRN